MALATTAEYKTSRGISGSGFDTRIALAIGVAETFIREYCGRDRTSGFEEATWTEYLDGTGTDVLTLREWPVSSVTSVAYRTSATAFGTTVDSSSYYIDPGDDNTGELYRYASTGGWVPDLGGHATWAEGRRNIKVVYVGGYATVPGDLKEAVYVLVDAWYATSLRDTVNTQQAAMGVVNSVMKTEDERAATVRRLLEPWAGVPLA